MLSDKGVAVFFRTAGCTIRPERRERMLFYAFDLLHLDGEDMRGEPLVERKDESCTSSSARREGCAPVFSEHFAAPGQAMLAHACRMGLEGVVSKRADAAYPKRAQPLLDQVEMHSLRREFVILGYRAVDRRRARPVARFSSAITRRAGCTMAAPGRHRLFPACVTQRSEEAARPHQDKDDCRSRDRRRGPEGVWAKPELVAEIVPQLDQRRVSASGIIQGVARGQSCSKRSLPRPAFWRKDDGSAATKASVPHSPSLSEEARHHVRDAHQSREAAVAGEPRSIRKTCSATTKRCGRASNLRRQPAAQPEVRVPDGVDGQRFFQKHAIEGDA